jgi:secreted trypsin-like serine protease
MRLRYFALLAGLSILLEATVGGPGSAQDACKDPRRIVGGEDTDIKDHPWQVALNIDGGLCGGAIIAPNWVLTAAHCLAHSKQPGSVRVKAGVTNHEIGGAWTPVDRVVLHDQYDAKTNENDLALVKLKARPAGRSIPLATPEQQLLPCEMLEVTGWGRTKDGGITSHKLQKALVPFVNNAACNEPSAYNGTVGPGMMCAGFHDGGVDACQGDSGGPLVLKRPDGPVLVGIVSWGEGCARRLKYGVYTRVTPYGDWITEVIMSDGK